MKIGEDLDNIISSNVLGAISNAMTSLYSEIIHTEKEIADEIVIEMIERAKKVVNCYIEEQKATLLKLIDLT